jgi:hypothetical protein
MAETIPHLETGDEADGTVLTRTVPYGDRTVRTKALKAFVEGTSQECGSKCGWDVLGRDEADGTVLTRTIPYGDRTVRTKALKAFVEGTCSHNRLRSKD